jgi:hypothetical protein
MMRNAVATAVTLIAISAASSLSAQQREGSIAPARPARVGAAPRALNVIPASQARITGFVVTMHEPPRAVPNAAVRLRTNVGKIVATVRTTEKGEFAFAVADPGAYYVELVDENGRVLAVEDVGETTVSVSSGQQSTTIIRVPVALAGPWVNAAKAILAAAASTGIAGVTTTGQPASPER